MTCCHITLILSLLGCTMFIAQSMKSYERCKFAKHLVSKHNITLPFVDIWICLTEALKRNEITKVKLNIDGSRSYGKYSIRSGNWCGRGVPGGDCEIDCEKFIDNDLDDDLRCAYEIFETIGFNYWPEYDIYCRDPLMLPQVAVECKLNISSSYRSIEPKRYHLWRHKGRRKRKGLGWGIRSKYLPG